MTEGLRNGGMVWGAKRLCLGTPRLRALREGRLAITIRFMRFLRLAVPCAVLISTIGCSTALSEEVRGLEKLKGLKGRVPILAAMPFDKLSGKAGTVIVRQSVTLLDPRKPAPMGVELGEATQTVHLSYTNESGRLMVHVAEGPGQSAPAELTDYSDKKTWLNANVPGPTSGYKRTYFEIVSVDAPKAITLKIEGKEVKTVGFTIVTKTRKQSTIFPEQTLSDTTKEEIWLSEDYLPDFVVKKHIIGEMPELNLRVELTSTTSGLH